MKILACVLSPLLITLFSALLPAASAQDELPLVERPPLVLGQGEQRLLRIPELARYSLGSDAARVHALPGRRKDASRDALLIKGVKPGITDLWVWKKDGSTDHRTVRIEKVERDGLPAGLEKALGRLEEAEIILGGPGIVLRGEITSLTESARIRALALGFAKHLSDETELAEALLEEGERNLGAWVKTSGHAGKIRVERSGRDLWLRGNISNPRELTALSRSAATRFPRLNIDVATLPDSAPTVHFKVFLLELRRNRFRSIGLAWPAAQEAAFRVTTGAIRDLVQLDLTLQALEGEGSARILSKPELVVRAPGEAELFAGGELPIHSQGRFHSSYSWKSYGLTLKLKVTDTTQEQVRLDVFTEVSHLDPAIASDSVPGIQSNRMKTQVDARYGTPLLLSGLLQKGTRENARGLPLLRQIPILGSLFGSDDYLNERSELVAILLPSFTPPPPPMHRLEAPSVRGPAPLPRNWVNPEEERQLRASVEFPWNALR